MHEIYVWLYTPIYVCAHTYIYKCMHAHNNMYKHIEEGSEIQDFWKFYDTHFILRKENEHDAIGAMVSST